VEDKNQNTQFSKKEYH